jgi:hypothetical protein
MRTNPSLTPKQIKYRKELLAKIHLCPAYKTKNENDAWEDFLWINYGVDSCARLGIGELRNLLDYLCGKTAEIEKDEDNRYYTCPSSEFLAEPDFSAPSAERLEREKEREAERQTEKKRAQQEEQSEPREAETDVLFADVPLAGNSGAATRKQAAMIERLWRAKAKDNSDRALREFIARIIKVRPLYIYALTTSEARNLIAALTHFRVRKEAPGVVS